MWKNPHRLLCALKSPINIKGAGNWLTRFSRSLCAICKRGGIYTLHTVIVLCKDILQQLSAVLYLTQVPHGVYLS